MPLFPRLSRHLWLASLLLACGFVFWSTSARIARIEHVNRLRNPILTSDPASPTGYAGGLRRLIAPEHNNESYQWIAQTQQMLATGEWRLRRVAYDNAPAGRAVASPSLYRWWLALVARADALLSGRPVGLAVEHAALWADPALLFVLLVGGTVFVRRRFGEIAAAIFPLGLAGLFPFASSFLPGCPDDNGLGLVFAFGCVFGLAAGVMPGAGPPQSGRWFVFSGFFGGLGLWLNLSTFSPLLPGLGLGAAAATWFTRRNSLVLPWRAWAIAGAVTTTAAWLIDYAPDRLDLRELKITQVHLVYALAWLGLGELLLALQRRLQGDPVTKSGWVRLAGAVVLMAIPVVVMRWKDTPGFLIDRSYAYRLTALDQDSAAPNFATWIVHQATAPKFLAVVLPLAALVPAIVVLWRGATGPGHQFALVTLLGPALLLFAAAWSQLSWWSLLDLLLLLLLATALAGRTLDGSIRPLGRSALAVVGAALVGIWVGGPPPGDPTSLPPTRREMEGVLEREFAHWLARRAGPEGAIVLAPPNLTASLIFHGGQRGLGSPYRENEEGFRVSVRLAGSVQADEAQAIARQRRLTHIAIPSWENFLDEYARLAGGDIERTLMGLLHQWLAPRWLRPVPYYLPQVPGFEDDRLVVFEMTEVQDHAAGLSRLTEYFIDMGQFELASIASRTLAAEYAGDLGALIAQARTAIAARDRAGLARTMPLILAGLKDGSADALPWDRRVGLSVVLAEANHLAEAREQAQQCLDEMGELDLRGLSEATLYRFLGLCKSLNLAIEDPELRELAKSLLPATLQTEF